MRLPYLLGAALLTVIGCGEADLSRSDSSSATSGNGGSTETTSSANGGSGPATGSGGGDSRAVVDAGFFTVQVPSDSAGTTGLAVRVHHPASDAARYPEGAPVVLNVRGGWGSNGLNPPQNDPDVEQHGYILVDVVFPGGSSPDGAQSGGVYDQRGANCIAALRDTLRYAAGMLADADGQLISDHLPFALTDQVGMFGGSNGGNIAVVTLAEHASDLPSVRWLAAWESPIGDQYAAVELNNNPFYVPGTCTITSCPWPGIETALRFDPNGTTKTKGVNLAGVLFLDDNSNGSHNQGELSFGLALGPGATNQPQLFVSQEMAALLDAHEATVFNGEARPTWLANTQQTASYWQLRDASLRVTEASSSFPDLLVMQLGTAQDHVQTQPDYPHSRSHIAAWLAAGHAFVRLNPDAVYLAELSGQDAAAFPDNDAGIEVPWPQTESTMIPEQVNGAKMDPLVGLAGRLELMDRSYAGDNSTNLSQTLGR